MIYYILMEKETGEILRDSTGSMVTFTKKPSPTFKYIVSFLEEEQVEKEFNNKLDKENGL
jgi:hypothetical protein